MPHINNNKKFAFVHIPKCAGNSVKKVLNLTGQNHGTIRQNYIPSYFNFTFVRNPWDRFISSYEYIKAGGWGANFPDQDWDRHFCNSLNNFNSIHEFARNSAVWRGWLHFTTQFEYVSINDKTDCLDFIGRVENLQEDLKYICEEIGCKYSIAPHNNKTKTKQKHYTSYYDDELKEIVGSVYAKDIEYFGYKFGE
ncbi:sulfotransferase family protein [bacterium]|nr:sulfotransferase family protein [bacterium]